MSFDLVIFDCDGVLVDSEVISCRAHADTLTRHGFPITPDGVLKRFLGVSDREARRIVESWRIDYNTVRPHSSLGGLPPSAFASRPLTRGYFEAGSNL